MMIWLENVSKWYGDNGGEASPVLLDISLSIPDGEFVCILGPSGCGKTTLLNLIAGFVRPSNGKILFDGQPVARPGPDRGVVFQDANLFPWLTARKNVEFGLRQKKTAGNAYSKRAKKYLHLVGMEAHGDAFPHMLSGGMKQRIAIARVLALEPKALLMDEPFSSLDANTREHLQDKLLSIWRDHRHTLVYVTHSVEEAAYLAERVIVMGPAPNNIHADIPLPARQGRNRFSAETREAISRLRASLDALPCCIAGPVRIGSKCR